MERGLLCFVLLSVFVVAGVVGVFVVVVVVVPSFKGTITFSKDELSNG